MFDLYLCNGSIFWIISYKDFIRCTSSSPCKKRLIGLYMGCVQVYTKEKVPRRVCWSSFPLSVFVFLCRWRWLFSRFVLRRWVNWHQATHCFERCCLRLSRDYSVEERRSKKKKFIITWVLIFSVLLSRRQIFLKIKINTLLFSTNVFPWPWKDLISLGLLTLVLRSQPTLFRSSS